MFEEDDLRPLSALQHLVFCERQCALIHIEQVWVENRFTAEGRLLHERVDHDKGESRGDLRIARGLPLRSLRLGLVGKADVVEFHRVEGDGPGVTLDDASGRWQPYPVEYKRGKPKIHRADEVQLCAQALCLEEMLQFSPLNPPRGTLQPAIHEGALYYGQKRRRQVVPFDQELRTLTENAARRFHELLAAGKTPVAVREPKCEQCSLLHVCLPDAPHASARSYLADLLGKSSPRPPEKSSPRPPPFSKEGKKEEEGEQDEDARRRREVPFPPLKKGGQGGFPEGGQGGFLP